MSRSQRVPARHQVKTADTWDLSSLYRSEKAWESDFKKFQKMATDFAQYRGKLGSSARQLAQCMAHDSACDRLGERLAIYAFLRTAEDQANSDAQSLYGRFQKAATRAGEEASFIRPEILSLPKKKLKQYQTSKELAPYRLLLERIVRYKPHTLGDKEEQLLAMQGEMAQSASRIFRQLLDADMRFGEVKNEQGRKVELTNATISQLLHSPKRSIRKTAFHQYYEQFAAHENSLSAALAGSVNTDIYYARARGYDSALDAALFPDNVPRSVYDSLIAAVRRKLPVLYRYYELRRRKMKLKTIHFYDTYVPILSELDTRRTWKQATKTILESLKPLGDEYGEVLAAGLNGRWCDRYPNKGKQSGAFSCGSYDADPYILMNYKPKVLDDMFTLTHEAGHSMHSHYSARNQPFEYYTYTIFVAEVASTFNEQLLSHHLMEQAGDDKERAYLINRDIDAIRSTIIRQTMFAEFERNIHEMAEAGEPLTCQAFKDVYSKLLETYFGPDFTLNNELSLEGLRVPHFYRAFYVYKYATGLSAAIALSHRVLKGGEAELGDYLGFLKAGCSKFPLDLLRDAGVDMESRQPVNTALKRFEQLVGELDELL